MTKLSKIAGLIFTAAASVYYGQAIAAGPAKPAAPAGGAKATDVRLLEDLAPSASGKDKTPAAPATTPPAPEGRSVSKSEVAVSDEGAVEIHVNDASLVEVLRMLSLQSQKNILCSKDVRGTVTANLYNVTIREALDQILHMNGYAYREKGSFINVYTVKELQALEDAERKTTSEVFRLHYTPAANAMTMIKPVLSPAGQVSATTPAQAGLASGGETGGNNHAVEDILVVTDYPDNLDKVRKILKEVDRRPQQVLVEAVILRAALSEDNALGVDFNVLAGVKFNQLLSNAGGQIIGANVKGADSATIGSSGVGSVGTGNNFTSSVPGGLKIGFVSDNVSVFLAALEGVTDTVVLANPKVLALNKQKGEVIVGRKDGYLTTTLTESATVQTVEFLDTGTKLIFRPFIGDDGYVRMELHPEDSSGGLTSANLPFKITTEMTSNIMVKDGNTVVIGGLFREASDSAKSQVPGLGNLPLAGALFRNQRDRTTREEIIILLTPHVIKDDSAYAKMSAEELRRTEQLRVGVRQGMMCWGRERLAESSYEKALQELKKPVPDRQKALWHLGCAVNLNPKFVEAIDLRQQLTGKEISTSDNSSIRGFVRRMVLADKETASPATPSKTDGPAAPAKPQRPQAATNAEGEEVAASEPWMSEPGPQPECDPVTVSPQIAGSSTTEAPIVTTAKRNDPVKAEPPAAVIVAGPATRPATASSATDKPASKPAGDSSPRFVVTELPVEEVKSVAGTPDDNK